MLHMDFSYTPKVEDLRQRVQAFLDTYIVPRIGDWHREVEQGQQPVSFIQELKASARSEGCLLYTSPSPRDS